MRTIWTAFALCCVSAFVGAQQPVTFATCAENATTILQARVEAIRDEILAKLNLTQPPPNPRRLTAINKSTLSAYQAAVQIAEKQAWGRSLECRRDTFFAKLLSVYTPTSFRPVIPPANMFEWGADSPFMDKAEKRGVDATVFPEVPPVSYKLTFELGLTSDTLIWASDLHLFKKKKSSSLQGKYNQNLMENVEVYYVSRRRTKSGKEIRNFVLVSSKDVSSEEDGYESFDVTQAVRKWSTESLVQTLELEVVIKCPKSVSTGLSFLPTIEFVLNDNNKENRTAQLVVAIVQEKERESEENSVVQQRKRQTAVNSAFCLSRPQEPNCCLRRLQINFKKDLGWTWILAPRSFVPNYCQGICPFFWPSASMSTKLLIRYSEMNPTAAVEPCCVAAVMKPLTLLMVINSRIVLSELSDMIVESCVCR